MSRRVCSPSGWEGGGFPGDAPGGAAPHFCTVPNPWREAAGSPGAQDRGSLGMKLQPELPGGYFLNLIAFCKNIIGSLF